MKVRKDQRLRQSIAMALFGLAALPTVSHADDGVSGTSDSDSSRGPDVTVIGSTIHDASTVGGKLPADLRDVPQSVTVLDHELLEAQAATSLERALLNVPGITIGGAEGGQIGNNINLRGFAARTDIYMDGFRDRGQYYRDTYYLESVEVLKGPSSMLFGRGSTGGVINQARRAPTLKSEHEVSVLAGDDFYRAVGHFDQQLGETAAGRIDLMGQKTSTTRDVMKNQDYGVAPSVRFGIGDSTTLTVDGLYQHNRDMPDYGIPAVNGHTANIDADDYYGLTDDRTVQNVRMGGVKIEHQFSDVLALRNRAQYIAYDIDARETALNAVGVLNGTTFTPLVSATGNRTTLPLSALSVRLASHDRRIQDSTFDNQTDLLAKFDTGAIGHVLMLGAELSRDTYENQAQSRNNLPIVSLVNPVYLSRPANSVTTRGNLAETTAKSYAAYVNDTLSLTDEWKIVAGARWDRFDAELTNSVNRTNTVGNTAPPKAAQTVDFTSVRSGLLYQPSSKQSYYISYGTSFDPSLESLTVTTGTQDLDPEKNRSYELGGKWNLVRDTLSLTSAAFEVEKLNARSQISMGVYQLDGDVRVRGFEFGLSGQLTANLQMMLGYTHLDAEIVKASATDGTQGKTPANTPRDSASIWTTYALTPSWQVGGGGTYMSNRYANPSNVVSVGDYMRWDATVAYVNTQYELRLNLQNLTDRRDVVSTIQSDGGRSVPEIGRSVIATLGYRF